MTVRELLEDPGAMEAFTEGCDPSDPKYGNIEYGVYGRPDEVNECEHIADLPSLLLAEAVVRGLQITGLELKEIEP